MPILKPQQLKIVTKAILIAAGALAGEAEIVSEFLVKSNLAGHDSHGVIRILQYVKAVKEGIIKPGAEIKIVKETRSSVLLDGQWGFGQVIAKRAMEIAIKKAKENGVAIVCAYNLHHMGRLADYTIMAAENDMIGIAMVNSVKAVAPYGGRERLLSTSPISYAFPTAGENPFVLDIATSVCAVGKVKVSLHRGEKMTEGYIIDKDGNPTINPEDFYEGGALLPLGGDYVGYKGFGLALTVEVLSGILSSAGYSCKPGKHDNGVFFQAIDISNFMPIIEFRKQVSRFIETVKSSEVRPGFKEILIPGEPELRREKKLLEEGIALPDMTWNQIINIAEGVNLDLSSILVHGGGNS